MAQQPPPMIGMNNIKNKWFVEPLSTELYQVSSLKKIEFSGKTAFQDMDVMELGSFGRCLVLDNKLQSAQCDEFIYHEALVQPALLLHPNPKRVFIAGGGEGATAREILRHKSVEQVIMVDIDGTVVEYCKKLLPDHHQGSFDDPRFKLVVDDAMKILNESKDQEYDVVVFDLCDPIDGGPAYQLYTQEFFTTIKSKLAPNGIFVTQGGPCGLLSYQDMFSSVYKTIESVWGATQTHALTTFIPSYLDMYAYIVATNTPCNPCQLTAEQVDASIAQRITNGANALKWYDGETHVRAFRMEKQLRKGLAAETRIIKKDNYVFLPSWERLNQ